MFQPRSSEFDPRVSAIVDHLRAIEELGAIGKIAGRRASSGASTAASQIVSTRSDPQRSHRSLAPRPAGGA